MDRLDLEYHDKKKVRAELDRYYSKNKIPVPKKVLDLYSRDTAIFLDELQYVEELHVSSTLVPFINKFPNVKSLCFDTDDPPSNIQIQQIINSHPNITNLSVIGQTNLLSLNLTSLKQLNSLTVFSNPNLRDVKGLENLNEPFIDFYDNKRFKPNEQQLLTFLKNQSNVDVLYYPLLFKLVEKHPEYEFFFSNMYFSEVLGIGNKGAGVDAYKKYSYYEIASVHNRAKNIFKDYIKEDDTSLEKYAILYQWMCENVTYDEKNKSNGMKDLKEARYIVGRQNGVYNALVNNTCVCQGYTRTMQFMLLLLGIDSDDISCFVNDPEKSGLHHFHQVGKREQEHADHSIMTLHFEGHYYYSDLTWDAQRYQNGLEPKYFLISYEDMAKDRTINDRYGYFCDDTFPKERRDELLKMAHERISGVQEHKKNR